MKFLPRRVDRGHFLETGDDRRDRFPDSPGVRHGLPVERLLGIAQNIRRERRDHLDFAAWTGVPRWATVAQANIIKHRFLGGRLRLLVAGEDQENQRLSGQPVNMAGVELGAEVDEQIELSQGVAGECRIGEAP